MKIANPILALSFIIILGSCQRQQFKGEHLDKNKQAMLKKKTESYHSIVSNKFIEENEDNKTKNEKLRQKRREAQDKYLGDLNANNSKVKKGKKKCCVAFNGF
ncbi:MAG TPA: hypothetical protein VF691_03835 [Cytophagaceae bacterium]|jgi:hypothetical protein